MANTQSLLFCFISSILVLAFALSCSASNEDREVYIVYMGSLPEGGKISPSSQHHSMLQQVTGMSSAADSLVRSYGRSFNGFAAKLTKDEKQKLASMKEVVSVFPSRALKLQTTRSWDFVGLEETISRNVKVESDIIVGVIDTGIWPESDSFKDDGFGPPPKKWKGACKGGANFTCNNKIVGARFYLSESARDEFGHGTHTASTVAGNKVIDASFYGIAKGTARGGVPSSRIAVYKVCNETSGQASDILAGFDDAIADGVDIISVSLALHSVPLEEDAILIGSFHAMARGILTLQSAGNDGPNEGSVLSLAPWIFTVAASTIDRQFIDKVVLGDGRELVGRSINSFTLNGTKFPLISAVQASKASCSETYARLCDYSCLNESLVKGKIVACGSAVGFIEAQRAGALGSIDVLTGEDNESPRVVPLPASVLNGDDYSAVESYINSTKNPEATILKSEEMKDSSAPLVASFSSRGPNRIVPEIMKPDICAPGVNILAAFSPLHSPSVISENDKRQVQYNFLSGTSMSCPHASGVAAYVKSFHPDWSPSAIKSAIMTTASPMDRAKHKNAEFDYGSGQINPVMAISPGLVYEAGKEDYIKMLCNAGFSVEKVRQISGDKNSTCEDGSDKGSPKDLNYPSMTATVAPEKPFEVVFNRTVTNVGFANSTYKAQISSDKNVTVKVVPDVLSFKSLNEKKSFAVSISGPGMPESSMLSSSITWSDGTHSVRSPVIAYTVSAHKAPFA